MIEMKDYVSRIGFSISMPANWNVYSDRVEEIDLAQEEQLVQEERRKVSQPTYEERYRKLAAEIGKDQIVGFEEFVEIEKSDEERQKTIDAQRLRNKGELGNQVGYFEASADDKEAYPCVEVIKLNLRHPMTPLELYQKDKPHPDEVLEGKRPWRVRPVNGKGVVKYYYRIGSGHLDEDDFSFVSVYLVEEATGWIISCSSLNNAWNKYKTLFDTIIDSFHIL